MWPMAMPYLALAGVTSV
ncbi:hypothetical protein A2U01_0086133, partial [Trifolium medium]|nr:hypothetical protein [Trifolium medium]